MYRVKTRMSERDRPHQLHVLLSDDERRMLRELAARRGLTPSTAIRLLVRDEYDRAERPNAARQRA
jgi:hypothetical protein